MDTKIQEFLTIFNDKQVKPNLKKVKKDFKEIKSDYFFYHAASPQLFEESINLGQIKSYYDGLRNNQKLFHELTKKIENATLKGQSKDKVCISLFSRFFGENVATHLVPSSHQKLLEGTPKQKQSAGAVLRKNVSHLLQEIQAYQGNGQDEVFKKIVEQYATCSRDHIKIVNVNQAAMNGTPIGTVSTSARINGVALLIIKRHLDKIISEI